MLILPRSDPGDPVFIAFQNRIWNGDCFAARWAEYWKIYGIEKREAPSRC